MKKYYIIITSALLLLGCSDSKKEYRNWQPDGVSERTDTGSDQSTTRETKEEIYDTVIFGDSPNSPRRSTTSSSVCSTRSIHDDNMRGFDPASEDDMDDNGMSRYMENDDEEG